MQSRHPSPKSGHPPHTENESAPTPTPPEVMDVLPWPKGYGFIGGDAWWTHLLSQSERERLDSLIGLALLDTKICEQLVTQRDPVLLSSFGLPEQARDWLMSIEASTLKDLAQAIVAATKASHPSTSSEEDDPKSIPSRS